MREFVRFVLVGGTGAALYLIGSTTLDHFGLSPQSASLISYSTLVPIMYTAQRCLTFRSKGSILIGFFKYVMTQAASLIISYILPIVFLNNIDIPSYYSFGMVLIVTVLLNYALLKHWAFRK